MTRKKDDRDALIKEMDELLRILEKHEKQLEEKFAEHLQYHKENEGKWGLVALVQQHPKKSLAVAFILGRLLLGEVDLKSVVEAVKQIQ